MNEIFCCFASSPAISIVSYFIFIFWVLDILIFWFAFPNDKCWAYFHLLIFPFHIFSELSVQIFCQFLSCIVCFLRIIILKIYLFIYLFLPTLGLCCCARAFSSCGERGLLFIEVRGLLIGWLLLLWSAGSRCVGFIRCGSRALEHRLNSCGARA